MLLYAQNGSSTLRWKSSHEKSNIFGVKIRKVQCVYTMDSICAMGGMVWLSHYEVSHTYHERSNVFGVSELVQYYCGYYILCVETPRKVSRLKSRVEMNRP